MGNCLKRKSISSKELHEDESKSDHQNQQQQNNNKSEQPAKPLKSWEIRRLQQKNKDDFVCKNKENETIIKEPGSLNGLQYKIESCVNCDIYVLDHSTTIFVDECIDCRIFIGPCKASVFVRDCKSCQMTIACQQYRSRDCVDIQTLLYCQSQPVIESCTNMQFGCFYFAYPQLAQQFIDCGLPPWTNHWSDIYDFTKNPNGNLNYSYLPENKIEIIPFACEKLTTLCTREYCEDKSNLVVPITKGLRVDSQLMNNSTIIMLYPNIVSKMINNLAALLVQQNDLQILRTLSCRLDKDTRLDYLFSPEQKQELINNYDLSQQVIFIQLIGNNLQQILPQIFESLDNLILWNKNNSSFTKFSKIIFENWEDERQPN